MQKKIQRESILLERWWTLNCYLHNWSEQIMSNISLKNMTLPFDLVSFRPQNQMWNTVKQRLNT